VCQVADLYKELSREDPEVKPPQVLTEDEKVLLSMMALANIDTAF